MELGYSLGDVQTPALLRQARGAYSLAIRIRLSAEGLSDLPKNGPYLVGGLANGVSAAQLVSEMGLSDSQIEELLEKLLEGNFVEANDGPFMDDALDLRNTARGSRAANAVSEAIDNVNRELALALSAEEFRGFQSGLVALGAIKARTESSLH
jgi:hypothetical protein